MSSSSSKDYSNRKEIRWGIASTGKIASDFVTAINNANKENFFVQTNGLATRVVAVASRKLEKSKEFAEKLTIPKFHGSYEDLAVDPDVDIVYISTPNHTHADMACLMLQHGKHVLCEKPFAVNTAHAERMIKCAKENHCLLVEGHWGRWVPSYFKLRELLFHEKILGRIHFVSTHFGFDAASMLSDPKSNKELKERLEDTNGGGATLDVGSYGLQFAHMIFNEDYRTGKLIREGLGKLTAIGDLSKQGIDENACISIQFGKNELAQIMISATDNTDNTAKVIGEKGFIDLAEPWQTTEKLTVNFFDKSKESQVYEFPAKENSADYYYPHCSLFKWECARLNWLLSRNHFTGGDALMSWAATLNIQKYEDLTRKELGVKLKPDEENTKKNLFEPVQIGALQCKNRVIMSALTRNRAFGPDFDSKNAQPVPYGTIEGQLNARYYSDRAEAGLIVSEGTLIEPQGTEWPLAPEIFNDEHIQGWKIVTDAVHAKGGLIFCQLWHLGRVCHPLLQCGQPNVGPSAIAAKGGKFRMLDGQPGYVKPRPIKNPREFVAKYKLAAENAKKAGFDGVELHNANGYLLHQFLDLGANQRDDEWGGSVENRCRLSLEVLDALISVWGSGRVGIRLSPSGGYNDVGDSEQVLWETYSFLAQQIIKRNIAYVTWEKYLDFMDKEKRGTPFDPVRFKRFFDRGDMNNNDSYKTAFFAQWKLPEWRER
jgi:2,4-dienoyl-CoA reductase-like NADH-dependent reductase (Old Yellow Enzyme family)/predicted dehydrogenase